MIETLLHLKQDDVVILFSFSRLIAETQALLSVSRKRKLSTIAITDQEALAIE